MKAKLIAPVGLAFFTLFAPLGSAIAADVCYTTAAPTSGGVTVSSTGCSDYSGTLGVFGANESKLLSTGDTCVFNLSTAQPGSKVKIKTDSVDPSVLISISTSSGSYTSSLGDIGLPLTGAVGARSLVVSGSGYSSASSGSSSEASGFISLTNSPPSSVTSVSVTQSVGSSGSLIQFCLVDPGVAAPVDAQSIPTLGEWAMLFLASLMAMFAINRMRRQ